MAELAIAFTLPGWMLILPMVARLPCASAAARVANTARAQPITASRRSLSLVVPAWLASPRDLDPPPTVRPEPASHRHGTAKVDQTATLLDM